MHEVKQLQGPLHTLAFEELSKRVGQDMGASDWVQITQPMIDAFATLTGDQFFIHVDPARAAGLPFKGTIAHGFMTLSLVANMAYQVCPAIEGTRFPLNYGFNRLRFVAPVPVGSRVRGRFYLKATDVPAPDQRQAVYEVTIEIEGAERPALVGEWLTRAIMA